MIGYWQCLAEKKSSYISNHLNSLTEPYVVTTAKIFLETNTQKILQDVHRNGGIASNLGFGGAEEFRLVGQWPLIIGVSMLVIATDSKGVECFQIPPIVHCRLQN